MLANNCLGKSCPLCGASLRRRTLDKPEVIKVRLAEYQNRTAPILAGLKKRGYKIKEVHVIWKNDFKSTVNLSGIIKTLFEVFQIRWNFITAGISKLRFAIAKKYDRNN